jgi:DNA-directed RNA polymerase II subunit RPB1
MDLAVPMYHFSMIGTVVKMLRCVCVFCSHLLVDLFEGDPRLGVVTPKDRLSLVASMCKSRRRCPQCEAPQPKYTNSKTHTNIDLDISDMVFEDDTEREILANTFTAARAMEILRGISDTHVKILGGCPENARPEWMILTVLQIPPPISRPCITASDGSRTKGQDDVTIKLIEIFKANKATDTTLREAGCASGFMPDTNRRFVVPSDGYLHIEDPAKLLAVQTASYNLQQHLVQYFSPRTAKKDAKVMGAGGRSHSRTLRLIPDRWKGKKGRFRGNLGGKRVDFSSRTVASPAPDFDVNEVGIPEKVAFHLTFPERVTPHNKTWLESCVRLGYGVRGGAASVIIPDSDPIDLELCTVRDSIVLDVGWVVERHLIDGDWVLLNRQPSLHKMSIMAHRIRIIPADTFRLPVCDTTPYNADFDGDELNVHVLQTHDARAEAEMLMSVSTQMISPENNKPIIALVQDSLVGGFLMTGKDAFLERHQAMQVIMSLRYLKREFWLPPPAILKPRPLWTGKQLFSLLIPDDFMYDTTVRSGVDDGVGNPGGQMDAMERRVILVGGELMCGSLCKKTLGTSAGGVVHVLVRDWGFKRAAEFVGDAQRLIRDYMLIRGFSVGVGDCVMGMDTHQRVNTLMSNTFKAADDIQNDSTASKGLVGGCVSKMLGGFLTSGGAEVVRDVNVTSGNRISVMIESGAKGSNINIAQILSSVGQQSVEGGRIRMGVNGRTLPSFRHGDTSASALGFVCNSYGTGLTAQEYFFHAMGGREGLVDTAVKTAKTGYIQRRLSKAQEGLQVMYDSTVRNSGGGIIQFSYGGDSFFPTHLERVRLPTFKMDDQRLHALVVGTLDEWVGLGTHATAFHAMAQQQFDHIRRDRDVARKVQLAHCKMAEGEMVMPFIPPRMFPRAAAKFRSQSTPPSPDYVHTRVTQLVTRIRNSKPEYTTTFVRIYLRAHLTLRNLVVVHQLGEEAIEWVCETIWRQYNEATAEYGEMVGTLGASSIGAPCTQMTLNTFHTAGVLAHTVTQGVPRLKELIDLSAIKTPSVRIFFEKPYNTSKHMAGLLAAGIEHTYLNQVVLTSEVVDGKHGPGDDAHMVEMHNALRPPGRETGSDVVIRYILDREQMFRKQLTVDDVGKAVQTYLGGNGVVLWSGVNTLQWCVRVRVRNTELAHVGVSDMTLIHDFLMENMPVNGVHGIKRVIMRHEKKRMHNPATGGLDMDSIWVADTEGTNLARILALDGVQASKTFSNDIHETLVVLGIEAATHQLLNEIRSVLSHDGAYVNDRHLQVLVDVMTHGGVLSPVTRHSMSKLGASVYTRASFEMTQDVLTSGAIMGIKNKTNGVTENIMIGNTISGGTGCCDVITDKSAMPPPAKRTLVKALVRENKHVLPLNRISKASPLVHNKHMPGFVGKKRKNTNPFEAKESKKKRTLLLHSPQMRSGTRQLILHSP